MRISDWSSDVCSSDLLRFRKVETGLSHRGTHRHDQPSPERGPHEAGRTAIPEEFTPPDVEMIDVIRSRLMQSMFESHEVTLSLVLRSEEHTSELQSLMRISYAVFCLNKKNTTNKNLIIHIHNRKEQMN